MKIITYSKVGYNHPSQANWKYNVWKVDVIDSTKTYCMSYLVKETFGGDSRFATALKKTGLRVIETKGVYPLPKVTGVSKMEDIEDEKFINEIIELC